MRKEVLSIAKWAGVVGVSFAVGWAVKPGSPGKAAGPGPQERNKRAFSSQDLRPRSADGGGSLGAALISRRSARAGGGELGRSGGRMLKSGEIESLGLEMRGELDPIKRRAVFDRLLAGLTVENAMEIRGMVAKLPERSSEFRDFHYAWGRIAGLEAVDITRDTEEYDMRLAVSGWASADPGAAMSWLEGLKTRGEGDRPYGSPASLAPAVVAGVANTDLDLATNLVRETAGLDEENAKRMFSMLAGKATMAMEPAEAAAWAAGLPADGTGDWAVGQVARHYVKADPEAAAVWLGSLQNSSSQPAAYRAAFSEWVRRDPQSASRYLTEMPASPTRDAAIAGLVDRCRWSDPAAAVAWAGDIENPDTRGRYLVQAGQAYYSRDPDGAAAWLQGADLTDAMRKKIAAPVENRHRERRPNR